MDIRKDLEGLDKEELIALLDAYNDYIQEANEGNKYKDGWFPVCVMEFYDNDFKEIFQKIWGGVICQMQPM